MSINTRKKWEKREAAELYWSLLMGKNTKFNRLIRNGLSSGKTNGALAASLAARLLWVTWMPETHWSSSRKLFTGSSPGSWVLPLGMRLISVWLGCIAEAVREWLCVLPPRDLGLWISMWEKKQKMKSHTEKVKIVQMVSNFMLEKQTSPYNVYRSKSVWLTFWETVYSFNSVVTLSSHIRRK